MPNMSSQALLVAYPVIEDAGPPSGTSCIGFCSLPCMKKKKYRWGSICKDTAFISIHQYIAGVYTHHDKSSRSNMKLRDVDEQGAACRLMLDDQFWAGGHFYLFMAFFHITRIKLPKRVEDIVWTNLFWRPRLYLYLPLLRRIRVFIFVSNAGVGFLPPSVLFFLWGAPTNFSTWELSPPRSDVARAPELTRLARVRWARAKESAFRACLWRHGCGAGQEDGGCSFGCRTAEVLDYITQHAARDLQEETQEKPLWLVFFKTSIAPRHVSQWD